MNEQPTRVLFLCAQNSARSQMAEGLLRTLGVDAFAAFSAGTVATQVRPEAIAVMAELGIDISGQESKTLERFGESIFDELITVCDQANEACPFFPGTRHRRHWPVADPALVTGSEPERLSAFRRARDELRRHIETELLGR
jgi:arsenate reductase